MILWFAILLLIQHVDKNWITMIIVSTIIIIINIIVIIIIVRSPYLRQLPIGIPDTSLCLCQFIRQYLPRHQMCPKGKFNLSYFGYLQKANYHNDTD